MSIRIRFAILPTLVACLPLAMVSANPAAAPDAAKVAKDPIAPKKLAAAPTKAVTKPRTHVALRHKPLHYARAGSSRPRGPSPLTAQLNREALEKSRAGAIVDNGAQIAAYQDANKKADAAYRAQLSHWQASVFANTPPGYHVEPAGAPPGYHLEPAAPKGYHLEPIASQ